MQAKHVKGTISICAALIAGVALIAASGAGAAKAPSTARIDVSTKAAVVHYLRSIHVNPKGVVIQRGLRNYAGAHCPGTRWTCASTKHPIVQIAKAGGVNRFACRTAKCTVVQFGGASHGLRRFATSSAAPAKPPSNSASCVKTTGVTQSCVINQPNASGTNQAIVWMVTPKNTGLTQSSYYSASITQGPASAAGSSNNNIACVTQFVWLDASTTKTNTAGTTVTNDNHELITINQNSLTGNNTVQGAKTTNTAGTAFDCDTTQPLTQGELLTSIVNSKGGSITQNQDTLPSSTTCVPATDTSGFSGCANVVTDIEQNQNQAGGFKGSASGVNSANFAQSTRQIAVANTPSGTVTQQQNANVPAAPYSGLVGTINQDSTAQSTAVVTQDETQCQDSVSQSTPIPAPTSSTTTGPGSAACPAVNDVGVPSGVTLKQTQYGPLGVGTPPKKKRGRGFFHTKGYGQSQQTNAGPNVFDKFKSTQTSSQTQDQPGSNVTLLKQVNTIKGDCKSSGNGSPTGGACDFFQGATLNNANGSGTTNDGYTAGQIGGTDTGAPPPLVIFCSNGHSSCKPTPPPAPTLTAQVPDKVTEATTAQFGWTDLAKNGSVTYQCKISNSSYSTFAPCSPGDTFSGLGVGTHVFTVNAIDASQNVSTPDTTYTWNIIDANTTVASNGVSEVGSSQTVTVTTNALPAGTTATLTSITPHFSPAAPDSFSVNTCNAPTTGANTASCTLTFKNNSAAAITVTATAVWHFTDGTNTADVTRATDGTHSSSGGVTARFVDANTSISPNGVTEVGHSQTLTITTNALPAGTTASLTSITPQFSSKPDHESDTCNAPTTGANTASCTVTITNDTASTVTVTATAVWHFTDGTNTADVTRATDGTNGSSNGATAQFAPPTPVIDTGPLDGNSGDASFTFHDSDSLLTFVCSTDGTSYLASTCNTGAGPGTGSATVSSPPTGLNTFYVEATDGTNTSLPTSWTWTQAS